MKSIITIKSLSSEIQHSQEIANKDLVPRSANNLYILHIFHKSSQFEFIKSPIIHSLCWPSDFEKLPAASGLGNQTNWGALVLTGHRQAGAHRQATNC